jgi:hypothetical protein
MMDLSLFVQGAPYGILRMTRKLLNDVDETDDFNSLYGNDYVDHSCRYSIKIKFCDKMI